MLTIGMGKVGVESDEDRNVCTVWKQAVTNRMAEEVVQILTDGKLRRLINVFVLIIQLLTSGHEDFHNKVAGEENLNGGLSKETTTFLILI